MKKISGLKIFLLVIVVLVLCLGLVIGITKIQNNIFSGIEFSNSYVDRNGKLLQVFLTSDDKYRIYKNVTYYSPEFLDLLLLQEDQYFYAHHGINPVSLFKGFYQTYILKNRRIGGSTITMQAAKLKYNIYTKNLLGKIHQIFAALFLELCYSKQQILDLYVNLAPCGKNLEGFESASWYFFNKTVSDLTFSEKAMLCVLPQNPTNRIPSVNNVPEELITSRKKLFEKWILNNPQDKDIEVYMDMKIPLICRMPDEVKHFTTMLTNEQKKIQESVKTTIDLTLQKKCEYFLNRHIEKNKYLGVNNGAVLLINKNTMEVLANIGSENFYDDNIQGQVNATISKRSPGSTLKPFVYALALEQGIIHSSTMLKDTPTSFNEYSPDNFGSVFKGPVFAWYALVDSRNIPAIYLATLIKNPSLYEYLKKAGVSQLQNKNHYGLSIVLGSADITMLELTQMYSAITNDGIQKKLKFTVNQKNDDGIRMLKPESAFIVKKMLEKNIPPYQTRPQEISQIPIGYKTGTSVGFKDCWTVAFFDKYIICVWLGNFNGQGNNAFLGRTMAAPLAFNIADSILMDEVENSTLENNFEVIPENVQEIDVCSVSGCLPTENCKKTEKAWFIPGVSPIEKCKIHRKINIDTRTGYRTDEENKPYVKTVIREFWPTDIQELFAQANLPRIIPPDYPSEENKLDIKKQGYPPQIISPLANTKYVLRTDDNSKNKIVLCASTDADSDEVLWFCDDSFICRTKPNEKFIWQTQVGNYNLTAVDSKGRNSSINISIVYDWQNQD